MPDAARGAGAERARRDAGARFRLHTLLAAAKRAIDAQAGREAQACFAQARTIVEGARHGLEFLAARIDLLEAEQRLRNGRCAAAKSSLAAASAALLELGGEVSGWPMAEIAGIEGAAGFKPATTRQLPRPSHGPSACTHPRGARTRPPCCERASMRPGINGSGTAPWMRGLHADLERLLGTGRAPQLTEIDRIIEGASHPVERPSYGVAGFF